MGKMFKVLTAVVLAVVMAAIAPLNAFAATSSAKYISEVKIGYGNTLSEAKKWLTDQGYTVVDADLNEEAESALISARAVCLGYKTTNKADEAITDLKVMNMKGNYSFEAYEMVLQQQAEEIGIFVSQLTATLNEYRENYKNGLYKAKAAHDLLDKISDDDTGKTMGELLLNKTVQELSDDEYEAMTDEEKANHADMVKILMQGNSQSTLAIEQYLCMAADTASTTFVERLQNLESYDNFETLYGTIHKIKDGAALEKAMSAEFDDTARALAAKIDDFKELLSAYEGSELFDETDEAAIIAYFEENGEEGDYLLFCNERALYMALSAVEYEDGTLYDFFMTEDYDLKEEDRYMLYPLASVLSKGQRACLEYVSLSQLFDNGIMDNEAWKLNYDKIKADIIDKAQVVSAYAGINREVFGNAVALTNAAKQLNESSETNYMSNWLNGSLSDTTYLFLAGFAVSTVATIACKAALPAVKAQLVKVLEKNTQAFIEVQQRSATGVIEYEVFSDGFVNGMTEQVLKDSFSSQNAGMIANSYGNTSAVSSLRNNYHLLNCIGNVACVLMIVFASFSLASAWNDLHDYYCTDKTPIPAYIVDEAEGEDGKMTYTYYSAVTCNRVESGFADEDNAELDNFGDLNGDIGKEWLALYATKDVSAGNPIKADFLCKKGSNTAGTNTPLTMFGDKSAVNLVDEKYAYNDDFGGLYLFYAVGSSTVTGSVLTTGNIAIIAGAAVVVAAAVSFIVIRKKKKAATAE